MNKEISAGHGTLSPKKEESLDLHLFFDVYIEDSEPGVYTRGHRERFDVDLAIRSATPAYKFQSKLDITRYALASYQQIQWASATLRIVCQNPDHQKIYNEAKQLLPRATITRSRSATTKEYYDALRDLKLNDDAWIFFCPNNDHPFIGDAKLLHSIIKDANDAIKRLNPEIITITYSHHTESINNLKPSQHEWGVYANVFSKVLYETENCYIVEQSKLLLDSIHIIRLGDLKWLFGNSKKNGRVIRLEDTEFYLTKTRKHVMVIPKKELCRHYDGSMHIVQKVPPLFIPEGFFNSNIKIRYGYEVPTPGYTNINPLATSFSYQKSDGFDLKILLQDIPHFWTPHIKELDINPSFPDKLKPAEIPHYLDITNPWRNSPRLYNLLLSGKRLLKYKWKKLINKEF